jgi:hypothetical protein
MGALTARAHGLFDRGEYGPALEGYRAALAAGEPEAFKLWVGAGNAHEMLGEAGEAVRCYEQALLLEPGCAPAHWNLVELHRRQGRADLALPHEAALARIEAGPALRLRRALDIPMVADSRAGIAAWHARFLVQLDEIALHARGEIHAPDIEINATPLYLAYLGLPVKPGAEALCRAVRTFHRPRRVTAMPPLRARIRVAMVSTFFRNHSIGRLYRGIVAGLDRARFEVLVYSIDHGDDDTARFVAAHADRLVPLPRHLDTIADAIAADLPDVLYYPELGLDPLTYYLAYARLAPVQCMSYGHPATSGLDSIDAFLSSDTLDHPDAQDHYTEPLVRLPGFYMPMYERPDYAPTGARFADHGVPPDRHVYLCSQTLIKLHPDFDAALAGILRRDARAVVVLIEGLVPEWRAALERRFARTLTDVAARIAWIPQQSTADYLSLLREAHVVLDTFHFGGGISCMDTFAAGVPMVTLEGPYFRGRQAAVCARLTGVPECVVSTPEAYVDTACAIAADPALRERLRATVAAHAHGLFGRREALTALEAFLVEAVERARRGEAPCRA